MAAAIDWVLAMQQQDAARETTQAVTHDRGYVVKLVKPTFSFTSRFYFELPI